MGAVFKEIFDSVLTRVLHSSLEIQEKAFFELISDGSYPDHIRLGYLKSKFSMVDIVRRCGYRFEEKIEGASVTFVAHPFKFERLESL